MNRAACFGVLLVCGLTPELSEAKASEPVAAMLSTAAPVCHEDMACWNWRTMGNRRRGLTTVAGRFVVVSGPKFDALRAAGRISWSRSRRMTGDTIRRTDVCA